MINACTKAVPEESLEFRMFKFVEDAIFDAPKLLTDVCRIIQISYSLVPLDSIAGSLNTALFFSANKIGYSECT